MDAEREDGSLEHSLGWQLVERGVRADTEQDLAWIEAARRGDPQAFNRLVLKWEQRIFNLVLRLLGDREEAAEATQEVFLLAFRSLNSFKGDSRFSTWLYRIAVNRCVTRLRRRPPNVHPLDGEVLDDRLAARPSQEEDLLAGERRRRVLDSLAALSPQQRVVIELKFFQDETFASIADLLGLPLSTIKSRFYTALDILKVRLQPLEEQS